jgi:ABC-type multidrug transport system ATPase subunit
VRAFALLLGVLFHGAFSFIPGLFPGLWATVDNSPSHAVSTVLFVTHMFRMSLFFFIAGFFAHLMFHRKGAGGFWADRLKRIAGPLIVGWVVLFPAIMLVWGWGISQLFHGKPPAMPKMPPAPFGSFPLTHLWFLYFLLVTYAVVTVARAVIVRFDRGGALRNVADKAVSALVRSGVAALVLGLPLAAMLYWNGPWIMWFGIPTPDHSLIPGTTALVGFGTAFVFGWLVHRQIDLLQVWARLWLPHLAVAIGATVYCLSVVGTTLKFAAAPHETGTLLYAVAYCVAVWSWTFAITGIAVRFLSNESPTRRYLADSSYWLYLVHLPIVGAFQVLVSQLPLHWSIKLPMVLGASFAVLLGSYHLFVRYTWIGAILNGRKYPPRRADALPSRDAPPSRPAIEGFSSESLAELKGAHKSYGKTQALSGINLTVNPGELLALLGPNGAGKSTAISLWLGLLEPDRGNVTLMGGSPLDVQSRRDIGVMMQEVGLEPTLRVRELVDLATSYYPNGMSAQEALNLTGTTALANRPYTKLSGGQKRQVQFAIAICGRPKLLFLDEPTAGLDVQAREIMWAAIRKLVAEGCAVVLTTHYIEEAEALADRVVVLANGSVIASGTVQEMRSLVSRKHISCSTSLGVDQVRAWPDVLAAWAEGARLQITAADAESVVRRLLVTDQSVRNLEVRLAGLSEAFTQLTQEAA